MDDELYEEMYNDNPYRDLYRYNTSETPLLDLLFYTGAGLIILSQLMRIYALVMY